MLSSTNFDLLVIASIAAVAYGVASSHVAPAVAGFFARRMHHHAPPAHETNDCRDCHSRA